MDYSILEEDFDCSCNDVIKNLTAQYKANYQGGGPGKLEAFLDLIKTSFENAVTRFIEGNAISGDAEALKRIHAIAKKHAKKCSDFYSKL